MTAPGDAPRGPYRTTVVWLPDGGSGGTRRWRRIRDSGRELDALGPVRHGVAPNRFHHRHGVLRLDAHLEARLFLAPGLVAKREETDGHAVFRGAR